MAYSSENITFWVNECERQRLRAEKAEKISAHYKDLSVSDRKEINSLQLLLARKEQELANKDEEIERLNKIINHNVVKQVAIIKDDVQNKLYENNRTLKIV